MAENTRTVQHFRHKIVASAKVIQVALRGAPGMTQEQQVFILGKAVEEAERLLRKANEALSLAKERDFEAHQANKGKAVTEAKQAKIAEVVGEEAAALTTDENSAFAAIMQQYNAGSAEANEGLFDEAVDLD